MLNASINLLILIESKFIAFITLWIENCLKEEVTTSSIVQLIFCYLQRNKSNNNNYNYNNYSRREYQEKESVFDFKQNLVQFMNFVYDMKPRKFNGSEVISNYDLEEFKVLVQPNKQFFEASAIFFEYIY